MGHKIELLSAKQADMKLTRLAYEIFEKNIEKKQLVLAGIADRGVDIARLLKEKLSNISDISVELTTINIDKKNPIDCRLKETNFDYVNKTIIIIDDVANSGQTMCYALKLFLDKLVESIQVTVLIDRKHKKFPISSDYVGIQISTTVQNHITVEMNKGKIVGAFIE